ncbi:heterokaryon incompatibility protein-domain-containing protein [Xylaria scruposa]|nr:heterokaryon incompatibility protein-domain-containing protein [Xylaria scruposa]
MPAPVKIPSSDRSAVTYSRGTIEYKLLNKKLEEPALRARRANAHRPSPGELLRIAAGRSLSAQLERENEQQFQYSKLGEGEIRILRLYQSKHPDEPLRADLFKRKLEDVEGGYEALSYCWGTQKATYNIHIRDLNAMTPDGKSTAPPTTLVDIWKTAVNAISHIDFKIRRNLYDALLRLRSKHRDVYLWVDAICIDQSERGKVEKAKQLAMMSRIYNSASNVCVWLGEGYDGAETAFSLIRDIMNYRNFDEMILDSSAKEGWRNLISIMKAPWFSRRWVIQEIALSRDASVHCGDRSLHWDDFADAISLLMEKIELIRETFKDDVFDDVETTSACILVQTLCNVCRKADQGKDMGRLVSGLLDVETLVSTLLGFQATFPRDTIYSILALAKDFPASKEEWQTVHMEQLEINFKIKQLETLRDRTDREVETQPIGLLPNYKFSPRDLFIAFVTRSIYESKSLDIICRHWAPKLNDDEGGDILPSWISSLSMSAFGVPGTAQGRQNGENFVAYLPHDGRRRYLASGASQANITMAIDPTLDFQDPRDLLEINMPEILVPETKLATASYQLGLSKAGPESRLSAQPVSDTEKPTSMREGENGATNPEANSFAPLDDTPTRSRPARSQSPNTESIARGRALRGGSRRLSVARTVSETRQVKARALKDSGTNNGQEKQSARKHQKMLNSSEARQQHRLSGILCVEGFVLGEIKDQSEVMRGGVVPGEWVAKLGWAKDVQSENRVPDTLWRLLVADRMEKGGKPPQWYKRACLHGLVDDKVSDNQGNIHPVTYSNRRISELTSRYFKRVEAVVWNRRVFELKLDKNLHGDLAPESSHDKREQNGIEQGNLRSPSGKEASKASIQGEALLEAVQDDEISEDVQRKQDPIYGLAPQGSKVSDIVCILLGCSVPVVLSKDRGQLYKVVGEAYVHGMMDGEAMDIVPLKDVDGNWEYDLRIFELT